MDTEQARNDILAIFQHVLHEIDPERLTCAAVELSGDVLKVGGVEHRLPESGRVVVLGVGKSATSMARGAESALGRRLDHGLVVTKSGLTTVDTGLRRIQVLQASHPIPDQSSVEAGHRLLQEADGLTAGDLAIVLVSGGGSALVEAPIDGITLDHLKDATAVLLRNGADIWTLNAVRRRLSRIKAGGLARAIAPARVVNLILSDVLGNPVGVIASGLSVEFDEDDAWRIESLKLSSTWQQLPAAVQTRLATPRGSVQPPKSNVVQTVVIADAKMAAEAAVSGAQRQGYHPFLLGDRFAGDAREFGRFWAQLAVSTSRRSTMIPVPACVIGAGEMTVTVRGDGAGGRNTEMAAAAALEIEGRSGVAIASLATDGDDGSSHAAGGVVDGGTIERLRKQQLDPREFLEHSDTRAFLEASDGLIVTGLTGTNVNDLYFALIGDPDRSNR